MAYNTSKGPRDLGDLKNEDDTDTQIDWESDYIGLKTDGVTRLVISGSVIGIGTTTPDAAAMLNISKDVDSEFIALKLTNESDAADTTGKVSVQFDLEDSSGTAVDAGKLTVEKESGYTSDPPTQDSSMVFATSLNGTLGTSMTLDSQSKLTVEGEIEVKKDSSFGATGQSRYFTVKSTGNASMLRVDGAQDCVGIGLASPTHTFTVSGQTSGSGQTTLGNNLLISGDQYIGGTLNVSGAVTLSGPTTGSVAGPGSYLGVNSSGLLILDEAGGSAAVATYNNAADNRVITSVNSSTINGEANLTFDGTTLTVAGAVSGSSTIQAAGNAIVEGNLQVTGSGVISGSFRAQQLHITRHGYNGAGTGERFIPFYTLTDTSAPGSADENAQMAFDGILKRVIFRPTGAQGGGSSRVALYKQTDGTSLIGDGDIIEHLDVTCSGVAATSNVFNFTGSSHFSAGDVVGVSIDPHLGPADTWVTCVWELEMFGIQS